MQLHALAVLTFLAVSPTSAFIAWSGGNCDGPEGGVVPCNGICAAFRGRHSFIAGPPGISHCVAFYVNSDCSGQRFNFTQQQGQCTNVNTGTTIDSFRCFAGAGCA